MSSLTLFTFPCSSKLVSVIRFTFAQRIPQRTSLGRLGVVDLPLAVDNELEGDLLTPRQGDLAREGAILLPDQGRVAL